MDKKQPEADPIGSSIGSYWLWKLLQLAAIAFLTLSSFSTVAAAEEKALPPPVIAPVSLSEPGLIANLHIKVVDHHIYYFTLRFSFQKKDPADRTRVRALTGSYETDKTGRPLKRGVPTPVLLTVIRNESGKSAEIYKVEIDPLLTSWGSDSFNKQIGFLELLPGPYNVKLVLLRAAPEFGSTPVSFAIGYDKFKTQLQPKR